jgi:hypothetical protein
MNYVSRRGLSTVVTTAMMLTFVAVIGVALVSWSNSRVQTFESTLANSSATLTNQVSESFTVDNVQFSYTNTPYLIPVGPGKALNVTVTNIGNEGIKITQLKINGTDCSKYSYYKTSPSTAISTQPLAILPKQYSTITVTGWTASNTQIVWDHKSQSIITITTSRGNILTIQAVAP